MVASRGWGINSEPMKAYHLPSERVLARRPAPVTGRLGRPLFVTLEAARVDADLPVLEALRSWLNSWRGSPQPKRCGASVS